MSGISHDGAPRDGVPKAYASEGLRHLRKLAARLPDGVELYALRPDGGIAFADRGGARELGPERDFLRFIDDGQFAHYLVGDAGTSPERPSNATVKLGVVGPRSAFTPHAHGGEHFVLSLGHAACGLYDAERSEVSQVPLVPGVMIRIPEMMPHSFSNRGTAPLTILAANTGYGIDHEDYAITAQEAERRSTATPAAGDGPLSTITRSGTDFYALAAALRDIENVQRLRGTGTTTMRERLATRLRRVASALEAPR
ncbi:cupin domain-containing protein [Streptomyces zagrosensis]|uniref:Mannose-6-phosphate isomerase-like protein (Cupin superfamily) n=1 Tax=Streptomyces zagrosensis TaxID=1042984 RepID=A0A7W9QIS7_9ACTN|nr:cupin domain-containing protein [Streptomyces zagrosensis]MBB5939727.1 mannose-6-phosphate isomerase-like protein (cupin superfamily) [Streptomyces zagrosensis]